MPPSPTIRPPTPHARTSPSPNTGIAWSAVAFLSLPYSCFSPASGSPMALPESLARATAPPDCSPAPSVMLPVPPLALSRNAPCMSREPTARTSTDASASRPLRASRLGPAASSPIPAAAPAARPAAVPSFSTPSLSASSFSYSSFSYPFTNSSANRCRIDARCPARRAGRRGSLGSAGPASRRRAPTLWTSTSTSEAGTANSSSSAFAGSALADVPPPMPVASESALLAAAPPLPVSGLLCAGSGWMCFGSDGLAIAPPSSDRVDLACPAAPSAEPPVATAPPPLAFRRLAALRAAKLPPASLVTLSSALPSPPPIPAAAAASESPEANYAPAPATPPSPSPSPPTDAAGRSISSTASMCISATWRSRLSEPS